ncbi:Glycosyltransferases involved in cell wall biogenesis [Butyrivibrio fibrisolvens 16/4]|nr:Glycosyltransferases involved in cell wall biogenesis [Butyrivibrio fibrisolvens 16/4]
MSEVRFSLIVPIYNVKPFLDRCMDSLLSQQRDDYEIILVDDGSTDGCAEMADAYAAKYSFVSCVHKENGGLSSARNKGLEFAKGEYVFFIDSDDWIDENALSVLAESVQHERPDVVKFDYTRMPAGEKISSCVNDGLYGKEEILDFLLPKALEKTGEFIFSAWSYIYRRDFLEKNSLIFISERLIGSEDYQFNANVFLHANSIMVISEALYYYDYREGSLTARYRPKLIGQYQTLQEELIRTCEAAGMLDRYKSILMKAYVWRCFSTCIPNEITITEEHSFWVGYINCKKMFSSKMFREAINSVDYSQEPPKIRVRYDLMKKNLIFPLVYSQYKSKRK